MDKLGKGLDSKNYWEESADSYANAIKNEYHTHRLSVIDSIIPSELYAQNKKIFDFGCGDAVHFIPFLEIGAHIDGVDISENMISIAQDRLAAKGFSKDLAKLESVNYMKELEDESYDAIFSYNVLAYLTSEEEIEFYKQAKRILKKGGYLSVTHSNELFDMYSLNRYTVNFFNTHLIMDPQYQSKTKELLTNSELPVNPTLYNVRENPLCYSFKLAEYGFKEVQQEFSNLHVAPPVFVNNTNKNYPSMSDMPKSEKWKLMFLCSTYGSLSIKE